MNKPKVSLVIPVYKGTNYMKEAIDSALAQTYENLEVIVVNDGSPDNGATEKVAKSYGDKIRYFSKENGGVSTALNLAIKNMKGEYFTWLSHDDLYLPNKVEAQVNYLIDHNLLGTRTILYADYALINENSFLISEEHKNHHLLNEHNELSLLSGAINGLTLFIPKKAFDECGLFDEKLRCVQDYQLWFDFLKKGYKFIHQDMIFTATRIHSEQTTNVSPLVVSEGEVFWQDVLDYYEKESAEKIYGSKYMFYNEMHNFFKYTPYNKLTKSTKSLLKKEEEKYKKNDDLVSIIISYNSNPNYLIRSIKSVLNNNYKNIEIIIADNNSKEKSKELINILKKNKNITIIKRKDTNIIAGINDCISIANGKYISFLNSGDEFLEDKISIQVQKLKASKAYFSHTSFYHVDGSKKTNINSGTQCGLIQYNIISENRINFSTVMIDSDYLRNNKIKLDETKKYGGYECFYISAISHGCALGIDMPLSKVNNDSTKHTYTLEYQIKKHEELLQYVMSDKNLSTKQKNIEQLIKKLNDLYTRKNHINYCTGFDYTQYRSKIKNWRNWKILKPVKIVRNKIKQL